MPPDRDRLKVQVPVSRREVLVIVESIDRKHDQLVKLSADNTLDLIVELLEAFREVR